MESMQNLSTHHPTIQPLHVFSACELSSYAFWSQIAPLGVNLLRIIIYCIHKTREHVQSYALFLLSSQLTTSLVQANLTGQGTLWPLLVRAMAMWGQRSCVWSQSARVIGWGQPRKCPERMGTHKWGNASWVHCLIRLPSLRKVRNFNSETPQHLKGKGGFYRILNWVLQFHRSANNIEVSQHSENLGFLENLHSSLALLSD